MKTMMKLNPTQYTQFQKEYDQSSEEPTLPPNEFFHEEVKNMERQLRSQVAKALGQHSWIREYHESTMIWIILEAVFYIYLNTTEM